MSPRAWPVGSGAFGADEIGAGHRDWIFRWATMCLGPVSVPSVETPPRLGGMTRSTLAAGFGLAGQYTTVSATNSFCDLPQPAGPVAG
jgi:hypothetical protein